MIQTIQLSIDTNQYQTLQQILLKFPYILQLKQHLGYQQFQSLIKEIRYEIILRKQPLVCEEGYTYLFVEKGSIVRRQSTGKTQMYIKIKEKTWATNSSRIVKQHNDNKQPPKFVIDEFDSYYQPITNSKYVQNLYFVSTSRPTLVLYLNWQMIHPSLQQKIRQISHKKLKFIASRCNILDKLHRFQYLQLSFGQVLYKEHVRDNSIFIVKKGFVEVISKKNKGSGVLVNSRSLIGKDKEIGEWARCATQKVSCFVINKQEFDSYFSKIEPNFNENSGKRKLLELINQNINSQSSNLSNQDYLMLNNPAAIKSIDSQNDHDLERRAGITKRHYHHSSAENIKPGNQNKKSRHLALRQHFSNYYNQIFDEFSEKKLKQMGSSFQQNENLNLYKIKTLERKAPVMDELKRKLKRIRLQRIKACQAKVTKKVTIQTLPGLGVTVIEEEL